MNRLMRATPFFSSRAGVLGLGPELESIGIWPGSMGLKSLEVELESKIDEDLMGGIPLAAALRWAAS